MIKQTKFSNLQLNGSFYIDDEEQLFIKSGEKEYYSKGVKFNIDESVDIMCDEERMIIKPKPPEKPRKFLAW